MATIKKVSKAKNISAGPSKKSPIAPKVDPKGQYTKVQERTLGSMKKGGKIKKAQNGLRSKADATRVEKPAVNSRPATGYKYVDIWMDEGKKPSSLDSSEYRSGYKEGISGRGTSAFGSLERHMGALEGKENYKKNSIKKEKTGGKVTKAKTGAKVDKKWIQKAINPKHKGYCTPMTKATCTPKRKALAHTLRKMAKKK
ncbi:MAG: hypothetical protein EB127_01310 [Alphaproteobacteria bacterium]|nr:hypothetical protein [Alphaproteobacteria bacterium]